MRSALRPKQEEWAEIPLRSGQGVRFIDSHVHACEYMTPQLLLESASATETLLLSCSVSRDTSGRTLEMAKTYPGTLRAFVGVHPSEAEVDRNLSWFDAALSTATGAGEIGLDPKYSSVGPGSSQMKVFEAQLASAERAGKPVQVHSRGAEETCLEVLSRFRLGPVLMHWFQGEELLGEVGDRDYFVSFGPAVIYSRKLQRMAVSLDRRMVLTESDGPVAFEPLGGALGPSLVPSVVFKLAELWQVSFEEASGLVRQNGLSYLGVPGKG